MEITQEQTNLTRTTTPVTITIHDMDDNVPDFNNTEYHATIQEGMSNIPLTIINHTGISVVDKDQVR